MPPPLGHSQQLSEPVPSPLSPPSTHPRPNLRLTFCLDDFKPASVDVNKIATLDVGANNTMTVTVPHLDGAGTPHTVFKGSQRPYHKECVLIIDKNTGEITLERLSSNVQLKKTRYAALCSLQYLIVIHNGFCPRFLFGLLETPSFTSIFSNRSELKSQPFLTVPNATSGLRPITPIGSLGLEMRTSPTNGRTKSRTKVASGKKREPSHQLRPKHSPPRASYHGKSPPSTNLPTSIR